VLQICSHSQDLLERSMRPEDPQAVPIVLLVFSS
jgi:hypothetical protein